MSVQPPSQCQQALSPIDVAVDQVLVTVSRASPDEVHVRERVRVRVEARGEQAGHRRSGRGAEASVLRLNAARHARDGDEEKWQRGQQVEFSFSETIEAIEQRVDEAWERAVEMYETALLFYELQTGFGEEAEPPPRKGSSDGS